MKLPQQTSFAPRQNGPLFTAQPGILPSACVGATVGGGKACIRAPLIGNICIPAPGVPNLGRVSVCCNIKKKWFVPVGVKCCVKYQGVDIKCKSWGL